MLFLYGLYMNHIHKEREQTVQFIVYEKTLTDSTDKCSETHFRMEIITAQCNVKVKKTSYMSDQLTDAAARQSIKRIKRTETVTD